MTETRVQRRERERREEARRELEFEREVEREVERREKARRRTSGNDEKGEGSRRKRIREIERELELEYRLEGERKRKRRNRGALIALIIVLVLAVLCFRACQESKPGGATPIVMPGSGEFEDSSRINILFLGTNQGLSDTMMVFSLDVDNKRLDQISIPRDTYYYRSNYMDGAYHKMNSVYSTEGYKGVSKAVSEVLGGVPIHYYMELKPEGVKKIVDAMGGIIMDVPMDMNYVDVDQDLYIDLKAGPQLLNGDQCMQYLRFRSGYANGDLGRVSAQQEFLKAVLAQSAGLDVAKIAVAARSETVTNMSLPAQAGLMTRAAGMKDGAFYTHTIPGASGMQNGYSYFFHDAPATKDLMRAIYASS